VTVAMTGKSDSRSSGSHFGSVGALAEGLDCGTVGVWRWEVATGVLTWSHNLESIHGLPQGAFDGTFDAFARDIHPEDRERVMQEIRHALEAREDYLVQYRLPPGEHGAVRWIEARGRVLRNTEGKPAVMTGICEDVTAHKEAEAELALRARQHEAVVHLGELALGGAGLEEVFRQTAELVVELISADAAEILELTRERDALVPRAEFGWTEGVAAETIATSGEGTLAGFALRSAAPIVFSDIRREGRFVLPEKAIAHGITSGAAVTIGGGNGTPFGVLAIYCVRPRCISTPDLRFLQSISNILSSAIRAARDHERKELLIGELRHRVGNLFSIVQALHRQTGLSAVDAADLEQKFGARLAALATAHTLILEGGWQQTSLRSLLEATLAPYLERVDFAGVDVQVPAEAAFSFSMALHEMATNANKYGSFAARGGRLQVETRAVPDSLGRKLVLEWRENGASPPTKAESEGFGSRLIKQVVERQLGGQVTRTSRPDGLHMRIEFPIG